MTATTEELPAFLTPEVLSNLARDGFVVVPGLIGPTEAAAIRDAFMEQNKNGPVPGMSEISRKHADGSRGYSPSDPLAYYPRMMQPHKHPEHAVGPIAMRYMTDPRIGACLRVFMGEPALAVQTMFYFKPPGSRGQDFHQDNFYLRVKPGTCMAAWIALDDCDEENGGMMCVPDTQEYAIQCPGPSDVTRYFTTEQVEIPDGKHAVLPRMRAGDVLFFNGSTIHGSPPNTSKDRFRRSLICHYVPASTAEMSKYYETYDFTGTKLTHVRHNEDGGPCGTPAMSMSGTPH